MGLNDKNGTYTIFDFSDNFNNFKKYDFKFSGVISRDFSSIVKDKANNFWIGTQSGLLKSMLPFLKLRMINSIFFLTYIKYKKINMEKFGLVRIAMAQQCMKITF